MTEIILICGYRRTGKDTLCSTLINSYNEFKWRIYKHPTNLSKTFNSSTYRRTAFADALKIEVNEEYNIPLNIADSDKDTKQFVHHKTGAIISARDAYIELGTLRKEHDKDYWCKKAFTDDNTTFVVTDWRFYHELNYVNENFKDIITTRVYRSSVIEPPMNIESEHALDDYRTDFLLLPDSIDEFAKVVERFPQYVEYVACEII